MRIVLVSGGLCTGGAEGQVVLSAAELHHAGHDVTLLTYYPQNDYEEFIRERCVKCVQLAPQNSINRITRIARMVKYFREVKPDVVHGFSGEPSVYAQVAGRLAKVKCVFSGFRSRLRSSKTARWVHRQISKNSAGWIVNSNVVKDNVVVNFGASPDKVYVVPNGVSAARIESTLDRRAARDKFGLDADCFVVSMLANLRREKDHPTFLRMARRIVDVGLNAVFLVAGDGPLKEEVMALADKLGLDRHVRFLGRCESVADLYRTTDVAVLTSTSEGLPNVLIEAGGCGVPCVSTDNGGASDIVADGVTGRIVPVGDDEMMAIRVRELLEDSELRQKMGQAAKNQVLSKFSTEKLGKNLLEVYSHRLS